VPTEIGMTSLITWAPAGIVALLALPDVTVRDDPGTAAPPLACTAMSAASSVRGVSLKRLDSVIRASDPAILLCMTVRIVWLSKPGPPVVMLGDHALTRTPEMPCLPLPETLAWP
jgi:hypothetical protein